MLSHAAQSLLLEGQRSRDVGWRPPLGYLLYWLGVRTEVQTRGLLSGYYQYHARRRGLGVYGIVAAAK
jgi:hypothetical protein